MSESLNGARLEVLRHIHGLSQNDLGNRIGLSQSRLSQIEHGLSPLTEDVAALASLAFEEPLSFFSVASSSIPLGPVAFRKRSSSTATDRRRLTALFEEAARVFFSVSERSGYHQHVPPRDVKQPEDAAIAIRGAAGLHAEQPVGNVARLIERMGIGVVTELDDDEYAVDIADVSGIAMPTARNQRPLVAVNPIARGDVQRLTLAHELGHIVLDRDAVSVSCMVRSPQERSAFDFAGALLLPAGVVKRAISEKATLRDYLDLKSQFGVSVAAIIARAHRLGIISDDRKRTLSIQLSSRGWRYEEPVDVPTEQPLLMAQALAKTFPTATYARASHELGVRPQRLRRWAVRQEVEGAPGNVTRMRFQR